MASCSISLSLDVIENKVATFSGAHDELKHLLEREIIARGATDREKLSARRDVHGTDLDTFRQKRPEGHGLT